MRVLPFIFSKLIFFVCFFNNTTGNAQSSVVSKLTCEYLINPLGIDAKAPRFNWQVQWQHKSDQLADTKFFISTDSVLLVSKKLEVSNKLVQQSVAGTSHQLHDFKLEPHTKYFWKVVAQSKSGETVSSAIAFFETGYMQTAWHGAWISDANSVAHKPAAHYRKQFTTQKKIKQARAYIASGGLYELYINEHRVGNQLLDPAYTRFDRRVLYSTYDVTSLLQEQQQVIGVIMGNGWYNHQSTAVWNFHNAPWRNRPTFCLDLRIKYEDGTEEVISTARNWKTKTGPIIFNSIYTAEHVDARLELTGWLKPNYADTAWKQVIYRSAPGPIIASQTMHPIREVALYSATDVKKFNDSVYVVHFPKNISGVIRLTVKGKRGTSIRIKQGERLYTNGRVDMSNLDVHYRPSDDTDPFQTDIYILKGEGTESFQPRFNYKGFQYAELQSTAPLTASDFTLEAVQMHSDLPKAGQLSSSNILIEKIWAATNNSYLSNLFGYPTDCPQREKNGWTGDAHIAQETGLYNFDGITVYEKWLTDHRDEQQPNGVLPSIIPTGGWGYEWGNGPDWTSTIAIIPWNLYLFYGDKQPLQENYSAIKKYIDYINSRYPSGLTDWGLGDWIPVKSQTPVAFTSTAYYYKDVTILHKAAAILGYKEDAERYSQLAEKIKSAFTAKYFDESKMLYGSGLQTELSVALHFGLVPVAYQEEVAAQLAKRVRADGVKLDVGLLGTKSILNALSENGYGDLAYQLATKDVYPSWGWWIKNGATTLYENWPIDAASDISMNHIMFGEIGAWFFKGLGGLYPDELYPGFEHFFLKPYFPENLDRFEVTYQSRFGEIKSSWKRSKKTLQYTTVVPDNTSATVVLPVKKGQELYWNGQLQQVSNNIWEEKLGAGEHIFEIR